MPKRSQTSTQVLLDRKELTVPEEVVSVQDLMVWVQSRVLPRSSVIQSVMLDGEFLSESEEHKSHRLPLSRYGRVEIASRKTVDIALDGLKNARDVLPELLQEAEAAASFFRQGDLESAYDALEKVMSVVDWYLNLVGAIDMVLVEEKPWLKHRGPEEAPEGTQREFRTFTPPHELREKFALFKTAQQEGDAMVLARLLDSEIIPLIRSWLEEIPEILEKLRAERHEA
ncbi:MAG: hypothetical protein B1H03_03710 [Planctomycetales bacterium 4484_113]|nr:MAG: hypothetical protein B1H03_03710 [Planctomycetales bacterium 4484_113]